MPPFGPIKCFAPLKHIVPEKQSQKHHGDSSKEEYGVVVGRVFPHEVCSEHPGPPVSTVSIRAGPVHGDVHGQQGKGSQEPDQGRIFSVKGKVACLPVVVSCWEVGKLIHRRRFHPETQDTRQGHDGQEDENNHTNVISISMDHNLIVYRVGGGFSVLLYRLVCYRAQCRTWDALVCKVSVYTLR